LKGGRDNQLLADAVPWLTRTRLPWSIETVSGRGGAESGQITANRDVTVTATGMLDNRARISSGTDIRLSAATLSNGTTGRVEAKNAATLSAPALLGSGLITSN
jgi:adhesin HecA-like repeat protein